MYVYVPYSYSTTEHLSGKGFALHAQSLICRENFCGIVNNTTYPVKMLARNIARIARKVLSLTFLQDLAKSCGILQEPCRPQDLARSCRNAREKDLFLEYLAILAIFLARVFLLHNNVLEIVYDNFSNSLLV